MCEIWVTLLAEKDGVVQFDLLQLIRRLTQLCDLVGYVFGG